ncbi:hypothetical protein GCM10027440_17450 [Nocardiopsis coralliicola]
MIRNAGSAQSRRPAPGDSGHQAGKAARWALAGGVRTEPAEQRTLMTGLHWGAVGTGFSASCDGPPAVTARAAVDGIGAGAAEALAGEWSAHARRALAEAPVRLSARDPRRGRLSRAENAARRLQLQPGPTGQVQASLSGAVPSRR